YDMEDAMIINKSSMERGAFHGCIYKTKVIDSKPSKGSQGTDVNHDFYFNNKNAQGNPIVEGLELDGLPAIGTKLVNGSPLCRIEDRRTTDSLRSDGRVERYKEDEIAFIEKINVITPSDSASEKIFKTGILSQRASLTLRCIRNPTIGDKFASRHGQKGILSLLWPSEDMPFTESGIVPDILFNPHGFPSRMTVGMLIESMGGKVAAMSGATQDATPFRKYPKQEKTGCKWIDQGGYSGWRTREGRYMTEEEEKECTQDDITDYFGKALAASGYQYYGRESMYSGIFGVELEADIFIGCIYYQRLRHMVSDKAQVRSTGPIDALTHQPVKGRKHHGGIRFGEMERDALLAHGTIALLQDRLMHCSDEHKAFVCPVCGSLLSPSLNELKGRSLGGKQPIPLCKVCEIPCRLVTLPFVFRYICNELATMNICIRLHLSQNEKPLVVSKDLYRSANPFTILMDQKEDKQIKLKS
ncbi:Dna-directed Rna polymerase I RPA2, partial [Cardiosporidium cionae]